MKRRSLFAVIGAAIPGTVRAASLPRTPRDYEGPFYPSGPRHQSNDLLIGPPAGDVLLLTGQLVSSKQLPIANAVVDIWQTDPDGHYKHPQDRRGGKRRSEFAYWGEATTDEAGRFQFRTYVPGAYPSRPAQHIHYKVWRRGREVLTSQIYFHELGGAKGEARSEQSALQTVSLETAAEGFRSNIQIVV